MASSEFSINELIAAALKTSQAIAERLQAAATVTGERVGSALYEFVEQGTESVGRVITPIAENPLTKFATTIPGVRWLFAALGQVNVDRVQRDVDDLQRKYPTDTPDQLAQRVMLDTAWKAAGIGLATNFIPPIALTLLAIDLAAVSALQAEMIYRIALIYGFPPNEPARRGEVITLWALFTGSSELMKLGLSAIELLPGIGAIIGTSSNASLVYSMGYLSTLFYQEKKKAL